MMLFAIAVHIKHFQCVHKWVWLGQSCEYTDCGLDWVESTSCRIQLD